MNDSTKLQQQQQNGSYVDKQSNTREWLEQQSFFGDDFKDELESIAESSVVYSSDGEQSESTASDEDDDGSSLTTLKLGTQIDDVKQQLSEVINSTSSIQTVGNVNIQNSSNVHIGNVTNIKIYADVRLNKAKLRAKEERSKDRDESNETTSAAKNDNDEDTNTKQSATNCVVTSAFIEPQKPKLPKNACYIVPRYMWLAQKALAPYERAATPVEYVIISHTATESFEKQSENVRCIRYIQCFHIESNGWDDIAYNFLVGCDGNIYEGRGWGVVGAHTIYYNKLSLGVAFIGCFMQELPNKAALTACKNLLKKGVEQGHIAANYKLVAHCQCRPTESPGRALFNELKTWDHFYEMEEEQE